MAQNDTADDEPEFENRADLIEALRGKGWTGADLSGGREQLGFEIGSFSFSKHGMRFHKVGSWTTGAGNGYAIYRANVDGQTVDLAVTKNWGDAAREAYIAVHDDDGRGARTGAFSAGNLWLRNALEDSETEEEA